MPRRRELERQLTQLEGFIEPSASLEQYSTTPEIAASLIHTAALRGDLDRPVIDLGTGTGILAIASSMMGAAPVIGVDIDPQAIEVATHNAKEVEVDFVIGNIAQHPLCPDRKVTVVMNPPFGAQQPGADRPFLEVASSIASVSYSIHNAESDEFVRAFAAERGGELTDAFALELELPAQFEFHDRPIESIEAEAYRIDWHRH